MLVVGKLSQAIMLAGAAYRSHADFQRITGARYSQLVEGQCGRNTQVEHSTLDLMAGQPVHTHVMRPEWKGCHAQLHQSTLGLTAGENCSEPCDAS